MVSTGQTERPDSLDDEWLEAAHEMARFLSAQCAPPSTEPSWKWCEKHVLLDGTGPFPGRYRTELTPMVRWVFDACQNPRVRRVVVMVSAQSAKTQLAMNFLNWLVVEDPGPTMWVMAESDHMSEFVEKRLLPSVENCAVTNKLLTGAKKGLITFETMNLMLRGSSSRAKLQSDPVRRIICDERREWKSGAIDLLRKRTRTFHNFLELSLGTAGKKGDELHTDYLEGSQTIPHFRCVVCNHSQPFRFGREPSTLWPTMRTKGGLVWEKNETTCPDGKWNFDEFKKTVRFECEGCGHRYVNADKYALLTSLHAVDYNPHAPAELKSFHWNALAMLWENCSWEELAVEFLKAIAAIRNPDEANIEPMIAFITETLGEPWEDRIGVLEDFGFLEQRRGDFEFGEVWAEERARFIAADKQARGGEHYWYVVRAFGPVGKSRLVAYGRCNSLLELETLRKDYGVPIQNAVIDSGYNANEVYRFCAATGWKPFKGDDADFFLMREKDAAGKDTGRTIRQCWQWSWTKPEGDPGVGNSARVRLFRWSNPWVKDSLAEYTTGLVGDWTLARHTGRDYMKQMTAEVREQVTDSRGRARFQWRQRLAENHMFDCELMIHTSAIISKAINSPAAPPGPKEPVAK